jgi:hypothetical protein
MQNGRVALSSLVKKNKLNENSLSDLLNPIFQNNNDNTDLSRALFSSLTANIKNKDERNLIGLSKEFYKKVSSKNNREKSLCIYCGNGGGDEISSYIFPFVTNFERFPNVYSRGSVRSLKFCNNCMLLSFAAFNKILFKSNRKNNINQISMLMFFSYNDDVLKGFYDNFIQVLLKPTFYSNIDIPGIGKGKESDSYQYTYGRVWYPEDILAVIIDYVSNKIKELSDIGQNIGSLLFSFDRVPSGSNYINIYDSFDVIDNIYPFVKGLSYFKRKTANPDSFMILFRNLLLDNKKEGDFIFRRRILKNLFILRRFDWRSIESLVMLKASRNKSIPYIKSFILVFLDIFLLENQTFKLAAGEGFKLGVKLKRIETNPNRLKKFIFDLRRCRRTEEFLYIVNLMQARAATDIFSKSLFEANSFEVMKVGFLIGYSNAIFRQKKVEDIKKE